MIPATTTRLILIRHGEVHAENDKRMYGQADVRLSTVGEEQSRETGRALAKEPIHAVYSSDLKRAHFVAREVARHHGLQPQITPHLRERFFGAWQQKTWDEISREYPKEFLRYQQHRFTMRVPGQGENFADLRARVMAAIYPLISRHRGQQIAIAAHSGPVRLILSEAMRFPIDALFTFDIDYCSRSVVDYTDNDVRVRLVNGTDHLRLNPAQHRPTS
jgi:broad specificity phosphatase PhoE